MIARKALTTSELHYHKTEIRFCSVSLSGFEPSLSGFVPATTAAHQGGSCSSSAETERGSEGDIQKK
jgi:hypothetical protein